MSSKESGHKNGHGNPSAGGAEQQPGPSTGAGAEEHQTKGTAPATARSPALNFNAQTPSSSTELSGSADQQLQQHPYQRWPGDLSGPSSAPSAAPPPVLVSPHYSLPPHIQQQYQQHHLGAPPGGGFFYAAHQQLTTPTVAAGQHSPGQQRHYAPPPQLPQMLHPGMMYHHQQQPQQHMAPPYHHQPQQQYGAVQQQQQQQQAMAAAAAAAYWARANGQQQQMPTPPVQDAAALSGASTSARHTPQPPSSVPPPNPSPAAQPHQTVQSSPSAVPSSAHGTTIYDEPGAADGTAGADSMAQQKQQQQQRPRSRQQNQQHQSQTVNQPPPNAGPPQAMMLIPQAAAAHLRYAVPPPPGMAMMVGPPTGLQSHGPQQPQQQHPFAPPPPMGPPPHPPHMGMPPMHHYAAAAAQGPPPPFPGHPPPPPHPGMYFHPGAPAGAVHHPSVSAAGHPPPPSSGGLVMGLKPAQREAVEKLVMQLANSKQQLTAELVHERRLFFERLVLLNEQQGEVLSGPPQVSKSTVDLYSLYFAVKKKGGFEKTIKDKVWKHMCVEANADMQESSAAGFQLRKHYQKYLLKLECLETGQNAKELVEFAEKQKKKKKEKEPSVGSGSAAGPSTPSSAKDEQQQQPPHGTRPSSARGGEHCRDGTTAATPSPAAVAQQRAGTASASSTPTTHSGATGSAQGVAAGAGAEFGQFAAATPPFGHYQPSQWAGGAFQQQPPQGLYPPPRMAPPAQQQQQMMRQATTMAPQQFGSSGTAAAGQGDDEQQQQQQQRQQQVSSRLSTPAPPQQTPDQRPISRASSATGTVPPGGEQRDQQQQQQDERGEAGAVQQPQQQQQQQKRAQTPSSAYSANAPTPPLTTSSASGVQPPPTLPPSSSGAAGVPFYHPGAPYGVARYPPTASEAAMYGPPAAGSAALYSSPQQLAAVAHQQRYHQQQAVAAAAAASARYYPSMAGSSASVPPQQQAQKVVPSSAKPAPPPQQPQQQQQQQFVPPPSFYAAGNRSSSVALLGVVPPPPPMLPPSAVGSAVVGPPSAASTYTPHQQQPYAMPSSSAAAATTAWHYAQQQQHQFPANSLEAQVIAQVQQQTKRNRDKVYARDLYGATPARIVMALRSALHTETVWALNALNVQLYDDTALQAHTAPSLAQTPELLNLLVDHLAAALSLLFPGHFDAFYLGPSKCRSSIGKAAEGGFFAQKHNQNRGTSTTATSSASSQCSSTKTTSGATVKNGASSALGAVPKHEQPQPPSFMLLDNVEVLVPNLSSALTTMAATTALVTASSPRHAVVVSSSNGGGRHHSNRHAHNHHNGTVMATSTNNKNFTMVSRLGRRVKLDTTVGELPAELARELQPPVTEEDDGWGEEKVEEVPFLLFVERVRQSVLGNVCARGQPIHRQAKKAFGRGWKEGAPVDKGKENEFWEPSEEAMDAEDQRKGDDEANSDGNAVDASRRRVRLFFHRTDDNGDDDAVGGRCANCANRWHTTNSVVSCCCTCAGTDHFYLLSRPVGLQDAHADERMAALVDQCLALSNILRGYAFLPGHERTLAAHGGLLRLLSALIMLMVEQKQREKPMKRGTSMRAMANNESETDVVHGRQYNACSYNQQHQDTKTDNNNGSLAMPNTVGKGVKKETKEENKRPSVDEKHLPREATDGIFADRAAKTETMEVGAEEETISQHTATTAAAAGVVPAPETDTRQKWLLEVANQLRDDAFVIMAQLSAHLDLFDMDSAISWPVFDALLHWSVSSDLQARDPLPPFGVVSPRHYAFEILCKMSVLERNVDLLVSTGPWPRLEAFVRLLCAQICEEPPVREFAIVILNAMCAVSEPACYVAAVETPLLEHLVSFLEAADANMTQIVQQQGMHALRENPEIIGTSVGMLRRATTIMVQIAKHEQCRQHFRRLQHRLLQFTVSHFMDLRVAAMVANILFEIQRDSLLPLTSEVKRDGDGQGGRSANAAIAAESQTPRRNNERRPSSADDPATGREIAGAKTTGKEYPTTTTNTRFLHGGSDSHSALFNGTTVAIAAQEADKMCPTSAASSSCVASCQGNTAANVYVPSMVNNQKMNKNSAKWEEGVANANNECYANDEDADDGNGSGDRNGKTDTNRRRKRVFNYTNSNNCTYNENNCDKWNGHHPGAANARHSPVETVDQMPAEKRLRRDEVVAVPSSASVLAGGANEINNGSSVKVRERMRHNILSKKASLKTATVSSAVDAAVPTVEQHPPNKRSNGWIGTGGPIDDHGHEHSGAVGSEKNRLLLHNGTAAEAGGGDKNGGAEIATAAQNSSSVSPAGSSGGGGSSLTAVA